MNFSTNLFIYIDIDSGSIVDDTKINCKANIPRLFIILVAKKYANCFYVLN